MLEAILKWVLQVLPMASIGFGTHLLQHNVRFYLHVFYRLWKETLSFFNHVCMNFKSFLKPKASKTNVLIGVWLKTLQNTIKNKSNNSWDDSVRIPSNYA